MSQPRIVRSSSACMSGAKGGRAGSMRGMSMGIRQCYDFNSVFNVL